MKNEEKEEDTSSTSLEESLPPDPHFSSVEEDEGREETKSMTKAESSALSEEDVFVEAEQEVAVDSSSHQGTEGETKAEQETSPQKNHGRAHPYDSFEQVTPPPVQDTHVTACLVPPPSNAVDGCPRYATIEAERIDHWHAERQQEERERQQRETRVPGTPCCGETGGPKGFVW